MQISTFVQYLKFEKRFSPYTITAYHSDLKQFQGYIENQYEISNIKEVKHVHVRSWIVSLMQNNISTRSVNRKLSSLKSYFKFLNKRAVLSFNPTLKVLPPKTKKSLPSFIRSTEISELFSEEFFDSTYMGIRDKAILETLYLTGIRRSELIGLKIEDVDLDRKNLKVMGKGKKARIVPISSSLKSTLELYLLHHRKEFSTNKGYMFLTEKGLKLYPKLVYNIVVKYLSLITKAEKKSPHVLRHSFATHILENGAELNLVKELLGHISLAATQIYTHNSVEKMKSIYLLAHPKAKI